MSRTRLRFGPLQIGIMLLALATASIHFALAFDWLFYLNGIGYLVLLALLYVPSPRQGNARRDPYRAGVRWLLIGYAGVTVVAWLLISDPKTAIGYVDKAIEITLIALLFIEGQHGQRQRA